MKKGLRNRLVLRVTYHYKKEKYFRNWPVSTIGKIKVSRRKKNRAKQKKSRRI